MERIILSICSSHRPALTLAFIGPVGLLAFAGLKRRSILAGGSLFALLLVVATAITGCSSSAAPQGSYNNARGTRHDAGYGQCNLGVDYAKRHGYLHRAVAESSCLTKGCRKAALAACQPMDSYAPLRRDRELYL